MAGLRAFFITRFTCESGQIELIPGHVSSPLSWAWRNHVLRFLPKPPSFPAGRGKTLDKTGESLFPHPLPLSRGKGVKEERENQFFTPAWTSAVNF